MKIIGLGANLPSRFGPPRQTLEAALETLQARGIEIAGLSRWYESAPVPTSDQPWFVNAVARLETALRPKELMTLLHDVETSFGRQRTVLNAPRCIDLDLLDYDAILSPENPTLPHPRLEGRAFVLLPLCDVAPDWVHPVTGLGIGMLIARLPKDQTTRVID